MPLTRKCSTTRRPAWCGINFRERTACAFSGGWLKNKPRPWKAAVCSRLERVRADGDHFDGSGSVHSGKRRDASAASPPGGGILSAPPWAGLFSHVVLRHRYAPHPMHRHPKWGHRISKRASPQGKTGQNHPVQMVPINPEPL
uniref:Uncharacterized protein n=1 Tax=uncultured marine microorganism HF4000_APKG8K5 TaxID=455555 RepID=B3TB32_9ZZZZ|nr:hypothetical protein ALOHA_HF4000APKG8K5ctg1g10 [uncultured marine microorganism HF4000_APKG8K5]